jgi:hypothetical protein
MDLSQHPLFTFAEPVGIMSGENPRFPAAASGHESLKNELTQMGVRHQEVQGHYGAPEKSFLIYGLPREHLMALGKKYGQESVIHNEGGNREFIYTHGPHAGKMHPGLPTHEQWTDQEGPPEDYYTKMPEGGYTRLHFDFDKLHPAPVAPPVQQPATVGMTKHEIGHALWKALEELDKTSWNVKQQRANITPQQAEARRVQFAQSIGLKPQKNGKTMGAPPPKGYAVALVPAATRNKLPYTGEFGVEHETAHAMMTPAGNTLRQYQNHLTRNSKPQGAGLGEEAEFYDPIEDEQQHIAAVHDENIANRIEYGIDRRAGVDPHKFKSKFRDEVVQPVDGASGGGLDYFDAIDHPNTTATAQSYHQRFDNGAKFNQYGHVVDPKGVDAKINARAGIRLPGLRKSEAALAPHPHAVAYPWHDGHTSHHPIGHGSGGVLLSRELRKADDATYHQHAIPFGHIDHEARARGGTHLKHYDYAGKKPLVDKLVADHGYQVVYAHGAHGKPSHGTQNYNTKHLVVSDPSTYGDPDHNDSWRKVHELAHALTQDEVNKVHGDGRRSGALGRHRTLREAERALAWKHAAAHKHRELNKALGMHVSDEIFNRELNTVMHDATHRAVTGEYREPSAEGFTPHSHQVPLESAIEQVRDAARNLGLTGMHDLVKKSEGDIEVAEDKTLSVPEALHELHKALKDRMEKFGAECLELRKAETKLAKGLAKDDMAAGSVNPMAMSEICKSCGGKSALCKCSDCESYAKGEKKPTSKPPRDGSKLCPSRDFGNHIYKDGKCSFCSEGESTKKSQPNTFVDDRAGKGVLPDDKKSKDMGGEEGSGGEIIEKAGFRPGSPAGPTGGGAPMPMPPRPKLPGAGMPKPPKLPGMGKPAGPAGGAPKPPAMGAGTPAAKAEMKKMSPFDVISSAPAPAPRKGPPSLPGKGKVAVAGGTPAVISSAPAPASQPGGMTGMQVKGTMGLPPGQGAASGLPKPAQGVQTMAERVASRMPQGGAGLAAPPAGARPAAPAHKLPGVPAMKAEKQPAKKDKK